MAKIGEYENLKNVLTFDFENRKSKHFSLFPIVQIWPFWVDD
jgi:hypothetical protein